MRYDSWTRITLIIVRPVLPPCLSSDSRFDKYILHYAIFNTSYFKLLTLEVLLIMYWIIDYSGLVLREFIHLYKMVQKRDIKR